ncbi:hypothetical protein CMU77_01975 [Elizabethkingia anophelis]|nr:hypothetical protein [Elizabethkingia anophelis]MDV3617236.1 hypothetical protein [Elizabethkingia anophelis]
MILSVLGILAKYLKKEVLEAIPNLKRQSVFKNLIQLSVSNSDHRKFLPYIRIIAYRTLHHNLNIKVMENSIIQFSQITVEELGQFIEEKIASAIKKNTITSKSEEKPLYTREETAELLDVSFTTLYHWNKADILNAKKIGSRVYYSKEDVMALLNS